MPNGVSPPAIVSAYRPWSQMPSEKAVPACAGRTPRAGLALHDAQRLTRLAAAHRVRAPVFLGVLDRVAAAEDPEERLAHRGRWSEGRGGMGACRVRCRLPPELGLIVGKSELQV